MEIPFLKLLNSPETVINLLDSQLTVRNLNPLQNAIDGELFGPVVVHCQNAE